MADQIVGRLRRGLTRRPVDAASQAGATLLELTVALGALSIILVALLLTWRQGVVAYIQGAETSNLQQEARIPHERMTSEIRLAGVQPCGGALAGAVTQAQSDNLTIQYFTPTDRIDC